MEDASLLVNTWGVTPGFRPRLVIPQDVVHSGHLSSTLILSLLGLGSKLQGLASVLMSLRLLARQGQGFLPSGGARRASAGLQACRLRGPF